MQHSAVDLENYARLYVEDQLRDSAKRRQANEVETRPTFLSRVLAMMQSWFSIAPQATIGDAPAANPGSQLVPLAKKSRAASADPYAGMIVLVRGPRADAA